MQKQRLGPSLLASFLVLGLALGLGCATTSRDRDLAAQWYEVGNGWYDMGKWDKAGAAYSKAMALDPKLVAASFNLVRAFTEAGKFDEALVLVDKVLAKNPENVRALAAKAYLYYKQGDAKKALETYGKVLVLDPYAPDAIYNAALLREADGDYVGAINAIEPLARTKIEDATLGAFYARVLAEGGRTDDAIAAYERVGSLGKLSAADYESLGSLYAENRDYAKALKALESSVGADAKRSSAWFLVAKYRLTQAADGKGGLEALKKALDTGFKDKDLAAALLEEPVLEEREAVADALKEAGLTE